jgi:hypothetical protein
MAMLDASTMSDICCPGAWKLRAWGLGKVIFAFFKHGRSFLSPRDRALIVFLRVLKKIV